MELITIRDQGPRDSLLGPGGKGRRGFVSQNLGAVNAGASAVL